MKKSLRSVLAKIMKVTEMSSGTESNEMKVVQSDALAFGAGLLAEDRATAPARQTGPLVGINEAAGAGLSRLRL